MARHCVAMRRRRCTFDQQCTGTLYRTAECTTSSWAGSSPALLAEGHPGSAPSGQSNAPAQQAPPGGASHGAGGREPQAQGRVPRGAAAGLSAGLDARHRAWLAWQQQGCLLGYDAWHRHEAQGSCMLACRPGYATPRPSSPLRAESGSSEPPASGSLWLLVRRSRRRPCRPGLLLAPPLPPPSPCISCSSACTGCNPHSAEGEQSACSRMRVVRCCSAVS